MIPPKSKQKVLGTSALTSTVLPCKRVVGAKVYGIGAGNNLSY